MKILSTQVSGREHKPRDISFLYDFDIHGLKANVMNNCKSRTCVTIVMWRLLLSLPSAPVL
jgi:hypothetical protein